MGKRAGNIHLCEDVASTHAEHSDLHQRALTDGVKEISPYGHLRLASLITPWLGLSLSLCKQDVELTHVEHGALSRWIILTSTLT